MPRAERRELIERLQAERGGTNVITYITSTRTGVEVQMAMDVIDLFFHHLRTIRTPPEDTRVDLFIHSNGGEGIVPWRLVTLIREFCSELSVLVPNRAFSAATLTALGADEIVMHPMGMLGPTDPTVSNDFNPPNPSNPNQRLGISVEDVASYIALVKDDVGIRHEDELIQAFLSLADKIHPLSLGNVKRLTLQSRMMGQKLLKSRTKDPLPDHAVEEVIRKLTSELYFHGHPINRAEARDDVGLTFVKDAPQPVADRMWDLYEAYEEAMSLNVPFNPLLQALAKNPLQVPPNPNELSQALVQLPTMKLAYVESVNQCDVFESDHEVVLRRDFSGIYSGQTSTLRQEWTTEAATPTVAEASPASGDGG